MYVGFPGVGIVILWTMLGRFQFLYQSLSEAKANASLVIAYLQAFLGAFMLQIIW